MQQYFTQQPVRINQLIELDHKQRHHIQNVMRMNHNEEILISDQKAIYQCKLVLRDKLFFAMPYRLWNTDPELPYPIKLYAALIKNEKWEYLIQKATELGVFEIIPLITKRTIVKVNSKLDQKVDRWNKIAMEACEQSHRRLLVKVSAPIDLAKVPYDPQATNILASETEERTFINKLDLVKATNLIIGPEGGFTDDEVQKLVQSGYQACSLGKRILRAETAACYALSVIAMYGEASVWKK
ncbi:MAG: RsmE family RNA methyltransferase [Erysipelotrichaceae bacterium]|nr:RsmE family RNA methyltransferase [Erysipelotrichaceae bacterium]